MKAWEMQYESDVLDEAVGLIDDVAIKSNDGGEIIALVEGHEVATYIEYNSPYYPSCDCDSSRPCRHGAALVYYLERHPELYMKSPDFDEVFDLASPNELKKFLIRQFDSDSELKERFFDEFSGKPIDKKHYTDKLDDVFRRGEGRDFDIHGFHDLDLMESDLYDFIFNDVSDVLSAGEYDFACDLLIRIAKLLNDETISTYDSWYDLADRFMEHVNTLSFSIYLDSARLDELYSNMDHIMNCL